MKNTDLILCLNCLWQGESDLLNSDQSNNTISKICPCCESDSLVSTLDYQEENEEFLFI